MEPPLLCTANRYSIGRVATTFIDYSRPSRTTPTEQERYHRTKDRLSFHLLLLCVLDPVCLLHIRGLAWADWVRLEQEGVLCGSQGGDGDGCTGRSSTSQCGPRCGLRQLDMSRTRSPFLLIVSHFNGANNPTEPRFE